MAIWYATTIMTSFIDGSTGAYFNDQDQVTGVITAGTWSTWDKSILSFPDKEDLTVNACVPVDISARIMNTGSAMQGLTEYEVFYEPGGKNPMEFGESISSGGIQPIGAGGTDTIIINATQSGAYKLKAIQRPDYQNNLEARVEFWSETISVKCEQVPPKAPDKGGDESELEPLENKDKEDIKENQEVNVPDPTTEQSEENKKEETPTKEEEKQEPEQPAVPADPETNTEEPAEVKAASEQREAPPKKEVPAVSSPSPSLTETTSIQE